MGHAGRPPRPLPCRRVAACAAKPGRRLRPAPQAAASGRRLMAASGLRAARDGHAAWAAAGGPPRCLRAATELSCRGHLGGRVVPGQVLCLRQLEPRPRRRLPPRPRIPPPRPWRLQAAAVSPRGINGCRRAGVEPPPALIEGGLMSAAAAAAPCAGGRVHGLCGTRAAACRGGPSSALSTRDSGRGARRGGRGDDAAADGAPLSPRPAEAPLAHVGDRLEAVTACG